ncbi:MAG: carboxypeptidase regulatory-like domain-containing protein [Saprospiraceae bacterium]
MSQALKEQLKDTLSNGRLDQVFGQLNDYVRSLTDPHYGNELAQISARWKANERAHNLGTLAGAEYNLELNKINLALLVFIDEFPESSRSQPAGGMLPKPATQSATLDGKGSFWKKMGYIGIIAGILGGFAEFAGFINLFPSGNDEPLQLTVFVQGIDGKTIDELQNNGKIIVDFGNDRRDPIIGENGRTNLGEIPKRFLGKKIPIVLQAEGYEKTNPAEQYTLTGEPIYITVQRDNSLGLIRGIVKNRTGDQFIAGALVMIDQDTTTTTDSLGRFRLLMPPNKHKDTYLLTVTKDGYQPGEDYYKPKSTPTEIRLDKK